MSPETQKICSILVYCIVSSMLLKAVFHALHDKFSGQINRDISRYFFMLPVITTSSSWMKTSANIAVALVWTLSISIVIVSWDVIVEAFWLIKSIE